jgi:hypothetical protein
VKPRGKNLTLVAVAVGVVVPLALFVYPGYLSGGSACPTFTTVRDHGYCAESAVVPQYQCPGAFCGSCPSYGLMFQGAEFQLALGVSPGSDSLTGCVTEPNSTLYHFGLSGNPLGPPSVNWTSPDHAVMVEWRAPYANVGSDGQATANVTFGVSLALIYG